MALPQEVISWVEGQFVLSLDGIHGQAHWRRVYDNGRRLAGLSGADLEVVELFAYLHDARRLNDGWDRDHGRRAAHTVRSLQGVLFELPSQRLEHLVYACTFHSDGLLEANATVQTCWDADRLDLGRIGVQPDPGRLCTTAARDPAVIQWALARSRTDR
jgi:uncharacterized protein